MGELSPKEIIKLENAFFCYVFSRRARLRIKIENFGSLQEGYSWFLDKSKFDFSCVFHILLQQTNLFTLLLLLP